MNITLCDMCLKKIPTMMAKIYNVHITLQKTTMDTNDRYEICQDCYDKLSDMFVHSSSNVKISKVEL